MVDSPVLKAESLPEFFKDRVTDATKNCSGSMSPEAEFYLVNLLTEYTRTANLYTVNERGEAIDRPLALQFFDAMNTGRTHKLPILKKMGDVSLYISGFFGDSLSRKLVDIDYYINMGHAAYASISNILEESPPQNLKTLFSELAGNFIYFVDILTIIADSTSLNSPKDILRLYEKWLKTGSLHAKELLHQEGIIPCTLLAPKAVQ